MEKRPRLEYDAPPPQPHGGGHSDRSSCVIQAFASQEQGVVTKLHDDDVDGPCGDTDADAKIFQEPEHVAKPPPPQEIPWTATGPPELAHEACKVAESMRDQGCDFIVGDVPDILMCGDDEPPLQLGFDEFFLEDFMKDFPDL